jgi:hypothetical protein
MIGMIKNSIIVLLAFLWSTQFAVAGGCIRAHAWLSMRLMALSTVLFSNVSVGGKHA